MRCGALRTCLLVCASLSSASHDVHTRGRHSLHASRQQNTATSPHGAGIDSHASDHAYDFQTFVTRPDIVAPRWDVTVYDEDALAPGHWFVAPYQQINLDHRGIDWVGPYIYDGKGELIWSGAPLFQGWNAFGFRVESVYTDGHVEDMLATMVSQKESVLIDKHYNIHQTVSAEDVHGLNLHEFKVVENGTRLLQMTAVKRRLSREESRKIGNFDGGCLVEFFGFQELDGTTLEPVFTWSSDGIIGFEESTYDRTYVAIRSCLDVRNGYDYIHCNAVDKFLDGDYLLGCRYTNALYKISHRDGSVVWRLGGKKSDFQIDGRFSCQHHVQVQSANWTHATISIFDNAAMNRDPPSNPVSRGILLSLRTDTMTAAIVREYPHPHDKLTISRGSFSVLPNGNAFLGWTMRALQSEHARNGTLLMEAMMRPELPVGVELTSYGSYKAPWVGLPAAPPDVYSAVFMVEGEDDDEDEYTTTVFVSWNGATEVGTWNFHNVDEHGTRRLIANSAREGFETSVAIPGYHGAVITEALDRNGASLGMSNVIRTMGPPAVLASLGAHAATWVQEHLADPVLSAPSNSTTPPLLSGGRGSMLSFVAGALCTVAAALAVYVIWQLSRWWRPQGWQMRGLAYERLSRDDVDCATSGEMNLFELEEEEHEAKYRDVEMHRTTP